MNKKRITVLIDPVNYAKLKKIAALETRFISRQAVYWIRQGIREYEKINGEVPPEK